jgi:transposase
MTEELNEQLTPTQLKAIALLIEGKNDRETAEEVGVNRATVNTWRNQNQYFIAEYNSRINQLKDVIEATQHAVVLKAYSVLNKALDNELMK